MSSRLLRTALRRRTALAAALALVLIAGGTALAASRGAPWRLGYVETLTGYATGVSGSHTVELLRLINASTATGARALRAEAKSPTQGALYVRNSGGGPAANFVVNAGKAAFTVNSGTKIANLNADKLDGIDSPALQRRVAGTCLPGSMVTAVNANGTVVCEADDDTTYTGSHPIEVSGGTIGLSSERCDPGFVYKFAERGWSCEPDAIDGGNAATLDGVDSSGFVQGPVEAWHLIGAPGEPGFGDCKANGTKWTNFGGAWSPAAFYKDPLGRVHLRGLIRCVGGYEGPKNLAFTLPAGSTPAYSAQFSSLVNSSGNPYVPITVYVGAGGDVRLGNVGTGTEAWTSLEGISFRAAP